MPLLRPRLLIRLLRRRRRRRALVLRSRLALDEGHQSALI
jgi:hypothetical protein